MNFLSKHKIMYIYILFLCNFMRPKIIIKVFWKKDLSRPCLLFKKYRFEFFNKSKTVVISLNNKESCIEDCKFLIL